LVIGGAGFLGTALVQELVRTGREVTVLDLPGREPAIPFEGGVRWIETDVAFADQVQRAVAGQDYVFHFAWPSIPSTSFQNPDQEVSLGLRPSLHILEACLRHGTRKIIFPSTGAVYGPWQGRPYTESDPTAPRSPYASAKLKAEEYLRLYESKGLAYAVLRPGSAYGPGQNPLSGAGAATAFLYQGLSGLPIRIYGRGEVLRDYTFSRDIIACAVQAMDMDGSQIFNVSTRKGTSLLALSELCFRLTGRTVPREFLAPRESDLNNIILDNSLEQRLVAIRPTPLEEGLELTLGWLKSRRLE
jgi:UDP-glucose 4-epimerase